MPKETIHRLMLGTKNEAKIHGVQAACADLQEVLDIPPLHNTDAWTCQVESGVSEEPRGFPATIQGAQNRAQMAYIVLMNNQETTSQVALGIGVESGFIDVDPITFTLYNFDVCALFDGYYYYLGISPGFEYPRRLVHNIFLHRQSFQEARQYITREFEIEQGAGLVGVLANGLTNRPEMTRLATRLACIRYLQRHAYTQWQ